MGYPMTYERVVRRNQVTGAGYTQAEAGANGYYFKLAEEPPRPPRPKWNPRGPRHDPNAEPKWPTSISSGWGIAPGASIQTLVKRARRCGKKGRAARRRLAAIRGEGRRWKGGWRGPQVRSGGRMLAVREAIRSMDRLRAEGPTAEDVARILVAQADHETATETP